MHLQDGAERANPDRLAAVREALSVYAAVSGATWLLSRFEALPLIRDHLHLLVGALFLLTAMRCAERLPGGLPRYGMGLGGLFDDAPPEIATSAPFGALRELLLSILRALPSFLFEA